ncbi:MAG: DUF3826 domain-containing protein [Prolixibacteraceae bacterium]|nr:DUF3826 domain-containing protein [Prolixibacteraceae bacterium]
MKKLFLIVTILLTVISVQSFAQLEGETPEEAYTRVITGRADKIVDEMSFENEAMKIRVRDIIVEHYRFLNDADENRNADVAKIREEYADNKPFRNAKIDLRKAEQEIAIRDHHFAFVSELKIIISEEQIDQVKNGLTYGVLPNTYNGFLDMIPNLKEEEKEQILIWLTEAREHAIDGGSSREKHGWFGKYKGKINNYLSDRGYNLNKLSKEWQERLKKQGVEL